jgi:hypothetical protein
MRTHHIGAVSAILITLGGTGAAHAWHFEFRFVERVGTIDTALPNGNVYNATTGVPIRLRIQMGVFDDVNGPAPAGGFLGWSVGAITDSAGSHNSRTPGRLAPFNFIQSPGANGSPIGDPFQQITTIDAMQGIQTHVWDLDSAGQPLPMPPPVVRGINAFVSTFELTTTPGSVNYTITVNGSAFASPGWSVLGTPVAPNNGGTPLNPADDTPGSVSYVPQALAPQAFLQPPLSLTFQVPGPGGATAFTAVCVLGSRRRRR